MQSVYKITILIILKISDNSRKVDDTISTPDMNRLTMK